MHAARFIQFCDCYSLPLVFLAEQHIALQPMQLFMLAQATTPKLCLGPAGALKSMFDIHLGIEGRQEDAYDTIVPAGDIKRR